MSERRTPSSHSKTFGATFSTPSEIFKRYASPTLKSPVRKETSLENTSLYNSSNNTLRLESPTKSPSLIRYQPRFESPSERDDHIKSPSNPREKSTGDKNVKENFVLLDQDDFSQGIEVIRTKIDSIEDEMKSMQAQYSRFQEKVSGSIVNLQKNLDSFLNSIEFSTGNDKM